ncbi:MAG: DMT family transporter [Pseudomonadota bacterium]
MSARPAETDVFLAERRTGVILMLISAVAFSTAGLFTKGVSADGWSVIFWRGVFAALFLGLLMAWRGGVWRDLKRLGRAGWAVGIIGAISTAAFLHAFKLTTIANVALIYATAPFLAAAIAWMWFSEWPGRLVMIASGVALVGVVIIVAGSFGGLNLRGDLLALVMAFGMALWIVLFRRYPAIPVFAAILVKTVLILPIAGMIGEPFTTPLPDILMMAAFGLVFAVAAVAMSEAARRLPASEAALISALETPLALIWAVLLLSEVPTAPVMIGGAIILAAIVGSQLAERAPRIARSHD